jgi:hypothetical protein
MVDTSGDMQNKMKEKALGVPGAQASRITRFQTLLSLKGVLFKGQVNFESKKKEDHHTQISAKVYPFQGRGNLHQGLEEFWSYEGRE